MKTFIYCNQKGGVGKSTFAVHHALHAHQSNRRVLMIDLDSQGNSSYTLNKLCHNVLDTVDLFDVKKTFTSSGFCLMRGDSRLNDIERLPNHVITNFKANFEQLKDEYDLCIVDTPPTLGLRLMSALMIGDYVVCPFELASYSVQGLTQIIATVKGMKARYNKNLELLGFFANRVNARSNAHREAMREICAMFPQYIITKTMVNRIAIQEALDTGCAVWDLKSRSAAIAGNEMIEIISTIETLAQHKEESPCLQMN